MSTSFRPGFIHLLPVLSSTASVTFCLTKYQTLIPFLHSSIPSQSLREFWKECLYLTSPDGIGFSLSSATLGFLAYRTLSGFPRTFYGWGVVFALGHYLFGPSVAIAVEEITTGPPDEVKDGLRSWLELHTTRMITVDIPAMACFIGGFLLLLWS